MRKILIPVGLLFLASCYADKEDQLYPAGGGGGCDTTNVSFATVIQPILNQSCALSGCHDAATKSFGHDLSSYNGAVAVANGGRLLGSIKHETGFLQMPKNMAKLGSCEISKITAWVNTGKPQ